ncbi:hypothetical protein [Nocardia callitridis]|uniref:DUF222 domain-containing protein n=1 Tax=Nocardia callitridis TaxID=648753 RepID=A0ABP9KT57_9NOCA
MSDREAEVMVQLARARAELAGTGEENVRSGGGRSPRRSDRFKAAKAAIHRAEQARNRLLVELAGDAETVPIALAKRLGLTGREAAHIIDTARTGSSRLRGHVLGG